MLLENREENYFEEPDSPEENTANDFQEKERHKEKPKTTYQLRYPTIFKNLEEEPRQPRDHDEELSEDAAFAFFPPSSSPINVDRFLEPKVENKVKLNEEIPSEEDDEPYEPYQANLEIQRLIERAKSESEAPGQSAPAKIEPKFQVKISVCSQIVAADILEIKTNGFNNFVFEDVEKTLKQYQ